MNSPYTLENFKAKVYDAVSYERQFVFLWLVGNQITLEEFDWYLTEIKLAGYLDGYDAGSQEMEQI